jgi:V/A-type H+-transporting ATPase subunit I
MRAALECLRAWAAKADPVIGKLQGFEAERSVLTLWGRIIEDLRDSAIPFAALAGAGPQLEAALFVVRERSPLAIPEGALEMRWTSGAEDTVLCVGTPAAIRELAQQVASANGHRAALPEWLRQTPAESAGVVAERGARCDREIAALRSELDALHAAHRVPEALGDVVQSTWCLHRSAAVESGELVSRIRGWTSDPGRLAAALDESRARAVAHFPAPPAGLQPPLVLRNPGWARPFELFTRLLGMPSRTGADPSMLLAFVAPLMFGYMFGDVGQGIVLIGLGAVLGRRSPALKLLVAGGIAAVVFGLVFGCAFGMEGLVPALWLHPLDDPLTVIAVPLAGGAVLLLLGLAIGALEAKWAGAFRQWLIGDAWVMGVYLGALASFFHAAGLALTALCVAGAVASEALTRRSLKQGLFALGNLTEKTLQLLINTLSFVRIGAFALAHAGLSAAMLALADGAGNIAGYVLILILGNAVIIVIEALVVSIQTTRLVLFEFFTRFFATRGREFRPLRAPSFSLEEKPHDPKI